MKLNRHVNSVISLGLLLWAQVLFLCGSCLVCVLPNVAADVHANPNNNHAGSDGQAAPVGEDDAASSLLDDIIDNGNDSVDTESSTSATEESSTSSSPSSSDAPVTVLGLGKMGTAVAQCLARTQRTVHAWNRGASKRAALAAAVVPSSSVVVHETASAAVAASQTTLILIDDWEGTVELLRQLEIQQTGHRIVVFSTYTPTDIHRVQQELFPTLSDPSNTTTSARTQLIGGAIVGVPQTICSPQALILTSGADVSSVLEGVGRTVTFGGSDVGLAALANMALILVITFGVAGQELALLMVRQYMLLRLGDNDQQQQKTFLDLYTPLATEIGPAYTSMLLPVVSKAVTSRQYDRSYVPVGVFRKVLRMHASFLHQLGLADDTFLAAYLSYLDRVPNAQHGPAAWTELAVANETQQTTATTTVDNGGDGDSSTNKVQISNEEL